jgi:ketosteroid isomerase-like protein
MAADDPDAPLGGLLPGNQSDPIDRGSPMRRTEVPHIQENAMRTPNSTLASLERKFWQSMVDHDTDVALNLLCEPALMVSAHGAMKFDHAGYRKMAEQGTMVVKSFEISDMEVMFPNDATAILSYRVEQAVAPRDKGATTEQEMNDTSTWIRTDHGWRCAMHTETPIKAH